MRSIVVLACMVLWGCSGGGGGGGSAPPAPPPPFTGAVSGLSPFPANCGGTGGTVFVNAEVEPHFAVDPRDASHFVGAWQQDRWSNGSARGVVVATTFDGGTTWTRTTPPFTTCAGGAQLLRASDPWVAIGGDGTVHVIVLATFGASFGVGSINTILAVRSTDGGRTWSAPRALITDGTEAFNDKESITADPTDPRFVHATWDRLRQGGAGGPTYFARSTDAGLTWETARAIYDPGPDAQTIANLVQVLPDGTLALLFMELVGEEDAPSSASLRLIRSPDKGSTWSAPVTIATQSSLGTRDPVTGQLVRDGGIVPQMAVGPDGTLHVVWQDARFTGARDGIAYTRSTDGGTTWSAPVRVNGDPAVAAFTPQVHVRADGTVGVSYYDFRSDTPEAATLLTDAWLARSADGVTWSDVRLAPAFDLRIAPQAGNALFLGDYMGLASAAGSFLSLHVRTTGSLTNRTDVFLERAAGAAPGLAAREGAKRFAVDGARLAAAAKENLRRQLRWRHEPRERP